MMNYTSAHMVDADVPVAPSSYKKRKGRDQSILAHSIRANILPVSVVSSNTPLPAPTHRRRHVVTVSQPQEQTVVERMFLHHIATEEVKRNERTESLESQGVRIVSFNVILGMFEKGLIGVFCGTHASSSSTHLSHMNNIALVNHAFDSMFGINNSSTIDPVIQKILIELTGKPTIDRSMLHRLVWSASMDKWSLLGYRSIDNGLGMEAYEMMYSTHRELPNNGSQLVDLARGNLLTKSHRAYWGDYSVPVIENMYDIAC